MKKMIFLFFLCIIWFQNVMATEIGVRIESGIGILSAKSTQRGGGNSISSLLFMELLDGPWKCAPFLGVGLVPCFVYDIEGTRLASLYYSVPIVGVRGGYTFPIGSTPVSIPVGLSLRAAFPQGESKYYSSVTATNVALVMEAGLSISFKRCQLFLGMKTDMANADVLGNVSTVLMQPAFGFFGGMSVSL